MYISSPRERSECWGRWRRRTRRGPSLLDEGTTGGMDSQRLCSWMACRKSGYIDILELDVRR